MTFLIRPAPYCVGRPLTCLSAAFIVAAVWVRAAEAAPPPLLVPGAENFLPQAGAPPPGPFGFLTGISRSGYLLGDIWGLRSLLAQYGISLALSETSEVLGNLTGGVHRGAEYDGLTQMALQLDTQQAFGWYGGTFRASALQIHGRNLSADNLFTLQTASGIEAEPGARLWELWYQQKFLEEDRADVRIGQHEPRSRVYGHPEWPVFCQHDVRLADGAVGRFARWRSSLSAIGIGRAATRAAQRLGDRVGGGHQWQPGPQQFRRSAEGKPVGLELSAQRRPARHR